MPASSIFVAVLARRRLSSPSSPSSLRIALICSRSRNSRWRFSMPSLTSVRILSFSSRSASMSLAHASTSSRRASTSSVSSTSIFCSKRQVGRVAGGVGDLPGVGDAAQELGHLRARRAPRRCSRSTARYSRASSFARSVGSVSSTRLDLDPHGLAGAGHAERRPRRGAGRGSRGPRCRCAGAPTSSILATVPTRA